MPDLQDNDFALFGGKIPQASDRFAFGDSLGGRLFKPADGFQFPGQSSPHTAAIIQNPVPEAANAIMFRVFRLFIELQKRYKCLLQNIFGLGVRKSQRASIQDELRRFRIVKRFTPTLVLATFAVLHSWDRHPPGGICIKFAKKVQNSVFLGGDQKKTPPKVLSEFPRSCRRTLF